MAQHEEPDEYSADDRPAAERFGRITGHARGTVIKPDGSVREPKESDRG